VAKLASETREIGKISAAAAKYTQCRFGITVGTPTTYCYACLRIKAKG
jgi:hypothetical protein